jgi:hypothetical protein
MRMTQQLQRIMKISMEPYSPRLDALFERIASAMGELHVDSPELRFLKIGPERS